MKFDRKCPICQRKAIHRHGPLSVIRSKTGEIVFEAHPVGLEYRRSKMLRLECLRAKE